MPLYEYRCKACGEVFEKMVRWSETVPAAERNPVCPRCQSQDTQKMMSQVASYGFSKGSSGSSSNCGSSGHFN